MPAPGQIPPAHRPADPRRGSVIIFVLGIIMLTSFLIMRLVDRAAVELAAESKAAGRNAMRQEAYSALETCLAVLADYAAVDNGLHAAEQGWQNPLEHLSHNPTAGYQVEATIEDESGKLALATADENILRGYLDAIGVPATSLDDLVDALQVWTKADYVPQGLAYDAEDFAGNLLPYGAPQRALRSYEELRAIPIARETFFDKDGYWNEVGEKFKAGASQFPFAASNVNTASMEGMLALGIDPVQIETILQARATRKAGKGFFRSSGDFTSILGREISAPAGLGTEATCLHVRIKVTQGGRIYHLDAWVGPAGAVAAPTPARVDADTPTDPAAQIPAKRGKERKKVDSLFRILEIRENQRS